MVGKKITVRKFEAKRKLVRTDPISENIHLICSRYGEDWPDSMPSSKRSNRSLLSSKALAMELMNVQTDFEKSCRWLVTLANCVENFSSDFTDTLKLLEKLQRKAQRRQIGLEDEEELYSVLRFLRLYSRAVAMKGNRVTCLEACENVVALKRLPAELRRVVSSVKRKGIVAESQ